MIIDAPVSLLPPCVKCGKAFTDDDMSKVIFVDECMHLCCKDCLKASIEESYPDVFCLMRGCEAKLSDFEIRDILGKEDMDALDSKILNAMLDKDKNLVRCKCGNAIEFSKGEVIYQYKNDQGE